MVAQEFDLHGNLGPAANWTRKHGKFETNVSTNCTSTKRVSWFPLSFAQIPRWIFCWGDPPNSIRPTFGNDRNVSPFFVQLIQRVSFHAFRSLFRTFEANKLSGAVPTEIGLLSLLQVLWGACYSSELATRLNSSNVSSIDSNMLSSTIPTEFGLLTSLREWLFFSSFIERNFAKFPLTPP